MRNLVDELLPGLCLNPVDPAVYKACLDKTRSLEAFDGALAAAGPIGSRDFCGDLVSAGEALSFAMMDALEEASDSEVGFVVNYSAGKDSTLLLSLFVRWMMARRDCGRPIRPLLVAMSDTGSEFPAMADRMELEAEAIRDFARETGLPIDVVLSRPPTKNLLLVEVLGNGKPLPEQRDASNSSVRASGWCMDRVKGTPLRQITQIISKRFHYSVNALGVRSDESSARGATIARYCGGLPDGLSRLGNDGSRLAFLPIVHWNKTMMRHFLIDTIENGERLLPWRPRGGRELNDIYRMAAGPVDAENPFECSLTITKDGSVSNSCSDLSGTRMGCWMCMLSKNRSLANLAKARPRLSWLKKFHGYLYNHHRRGFRRAALRDAMGLNQKVMFPKTYTFRERYFMTMMVLRAEMESRETLLTPEAITLIETLWRKYGVHGITVEDARRDMKRWRETGKPRTCFDFDPIRQGALARVLGLSVPAGLFWTPEASSGLKHPLSAIHLLAMRQSNCGDAMLPVLRAHMFRRAQPSQGQEHEVLVMVTDCPSTIGTKTNTGLINGMCGLAWKHCGERPPTPLEERLSDGRTVFYMSDTRVLCQRAELLVDQQMEKEVRAILRLHKDQTFDSWNALRAQASLVAVATANGWSRLSGCPEEPLADEWYRQESEQTVRGLLSINDFKGLWKEVKDGVIATELLDDALARQLDPIVLRSQSNVALLEDEGPRGAAFRSSLRKDIAEALSLDGLRPFLDDYRMAADSIIERMRQGRAPVGLLERIAYIVRTEFYDPEYAGTLLMELVKRLALQPAAAREA